MRSMFPQQDLLPEATFQVLTGFCYIFFSTTEMSWNKQLSRAQEEKKKSIKKKIIAETGERFKSCCEIHMTGSYDIKE